MSRANRINRSYIRIAFVETKNAALNRPENRATRLRFRPYD